MRAIGSSIVERFQLRHCTVLDSANIRFQQAINERDRARDVARAMERQREVMLRESALIIETIDLKRQVELLQARVGRMVQEKKPSVPAETTEPAPSSRHLWRGDRVTVLSCQRQRGAARFPLVGASGSILRAISSSVSISPVRSAKSPGG